MALLGLQSCHICGGLRAAFHAQFRQQAGHVILDRFLGEVKALADDPVGQALADQVEDLALLVGQVREPVVLLAATPSRSLSRTRAVATGSSRDFPAATSRTALRSSFPLMAFST